VDGTDASVPVPSIGGITGILTTIGTTTATGIAGTAGNYKRGPSGALFLRGVALWRCVAMPFSTPCPLHSGLRSWHSKAPLIEVPRRNAGSAVSDAVSAAANKASNRFDEGLAFARESFGKLGNSLPGRRLLPKRNCRSPTNLNRNRVVLGAIGLAIAAAVAGVLRTSDLENESIGELSEPVKADLNTRAGAVSQSLREGSDKLKAEFSDTGGEAVRLKQTASDAADAAREKLKSSSLFG
jgi:hypothetical protein